MATPKIVTLNQVLGLFNTFVTEHAQLRDYGYGPTSEIGRSKQMEFPYAWVTHQSDSYIKVENKTNLPELKFVVLIMDQVNNQDNVEDVHGIDSNNGQDIMSDNLTILTDLVNKIQKSWGTYGIVITEDVRIYPAFDETEDKVNGWAGEVTLRLSYVNCLFPGE